MEIVVGRGSSMGRNIIIFFYIYIFLFQACLIPAFIFVHLHLYITFVMTNDIYITFSDLHL